MDIRTFSIPQDDTEEHMECQECGRSIRHSIIINGEPHGRQCAAVKLGWTEKGKKLASKVSKVSMSIQILKAQLEAQNTDKDNRNSEGQAQAAAISLVETLNLQSPWHSLNCRGWDFAKKVAEMVA